MLSGNKGEWSEIYVFLKLLSEGKLFSGDKDLNKINEIFYPIIKIIRDISFLEYQYGDEIKIVSTKNNKEIARIPIKEFVKQSKLLLKKIKEASTSSFSIPRIEKFLNEIHCKKLKASSNKKSDITIKVHDLITGYEPVLNFSIKSRLGSSSTLLNAGRTTNFVFEMYGNIDERKIKKIKESHKRSKIKDRIKETFRQSLDLQFIEVEDKIFDSNLRVIDSLLPEIISYYLIYYYKGESRRIDELTNIVREINPMKYDLKNGHEYYKYKIKKFLLDIALGMVPHTVWKGHYDATGGYIIVREDGEVLCYHIYNFNEFQEYLFKNTYLDTPSSTRHEFGNLYTEEEKYLIKLNLQIRFL